jgi:hypothetical protein
MPRQAAEKIREKDITDLKAKVRGKSKGTQLIKATGKSKGTQAKVRGRSSLKPKRRF